MFEKMISDKITQNIRQINCDIIFEETKSMEDIFTNLERSHSNT